MSETPANNGGDAAEIKTPFFSAKIAGKNLTLRDIVLLAVFAVSVYTGATIFTHADAQDKTNSALLNEIKESNKTNAQTQKNIAFYQCRASCLLEQPSDKKDGALCDRVCASIKQ